MSRAHGTEKSGGHLSPPGRWQKLGCLVGCPIKQLVRDVLQEAGSNTDWGGKEAEPLNGGQEHGQGVKSNKTWTTSSNFQGKGFSR